MTCFRPPGAPTAWVACAAALLCALAARADQPPTRLDPDEPSRARRSNPVRHEIDFRVIVTPPAGCQVLKVWLPVAANDAAQRVEPSRFETFPLAVEPRLGVEPTYGNRFAYFEFHRPLGAQIVRHQFAATVHDEHWDVRFDRVPRVERWPDSFAHYLTPEPLPPEAGFDQVLAEVSARRGAAGHGLLAAFAWIDQHVAYDHAIASLRADPLHALLQRRGHCSDYHGLCATFGRALGYPTRVAYGLSLYPKNSPSHCKLEAYLPPYGWVSFDLSETQKLTEAIARDEALADGEPQRLIAAARRRLHEGFREHGWLAMTRGVGYQLAPPAAAPVRVVRTAYIEADGQPLPEPDPANSQLQAFSWMTAHAFQADRPVARPFQDSATLAPYVAE